MDAEENTLSNFGEGRYSVIKKLGEGGKGIVYKCMDNNLNRIVAIKLIKGELLDSESYSRLIREAKTTAMLSHPNIVSIYDMSRDGQRFYMVVEYVDGESLDRYIASHRENISTKELIRISISIAEALDYAHKHGVLHRDVKPENIMISSDGTVKLMDFGLARSFDSPRLTHAGMIVGTPAYLSPESAIGKESDARSDLYSLGCVMYQMATGSPPFTGKDSLKLIYSHIHDVPQPPSRVNQNIPQSVETVIMKLLRKNPDERFQDALKLIEVLRDIREVENGQPSRGSDRETRTDPGKGGGTSFIGRRDGYFVGRDAECDTLRKLVDLAKMGDGRASVIVGEAGSGKTRLAEEVRDYAVMRGMKTITVKGRQSRQQTPHYYFSEMLREYLYMAPPQLIYKICGNYADVAVRMMPELASKLGPINEVASDDTLASKTRFYDGAAEIMRNISRETPLLLVLEDIQHADESTMSILETLMEYIRGMQLMILLTLTLSDFGSPSEVAERIYSNRSFDIVKLNNFDRDETAAFICNFLSERRENLTEEFVDFIYTKTNGNPLYVEEVLKLLIEKKLIFKSPSGSWERKPISEIGVPNSLKGLIKERLAALDDFSMHILETASIIGAEFDVEILTELLAEDESRVLDVLENMIKLRIISERKTGPGEFRLYFTNPQVYSYFYDNISLLRKRRMHLKIAQIMEKKYGEDEENSGSLAHYYLEGGDIANALKYTLKTGKRWENSFEFRRAAQEYHAAIELIEGGRGRNDGVLTRLEKANLFIDYAINLSYYDDTNAQIWAERALKIFREEGDLEGQLKSYAYLVHLGTVEWSQIVEEAMALVMNNVDSPETRKYVGRIAYSSVGMYWYAGMLDKSREILDWFIDYCERKQLKDLYYFNSAIFNIILYPIRKQEDLDSIFVRLQSVDRDICNYFEHVNELGLESDVKSVLYDAEANSYFWLKNDINAAEERFKAGLKLKGEFTHARLRNVLITEYWLLVHIQRGDWDIVELEMRQMQIPAEIQVNIEMGSHSSTIAGLAKAWIALFRGEIKQYMDMLRKMARKRSLQFISFLYPLLVRALIQEGYVEEAMSRIEDAIQRVEETGLIIEVFSGAVILSYMGVVAANALDRRDAAAAFLEKSGRMASTFTEDWVHAYHMLAAGEFEAKYGDPRKAVEKFEKARNVFRNKQFVIEAAIVSTRLAEIYQMLSEWEKGNAALSDALSVFTPLDCRYYVEKLLGLKELLKA